MYICLLVEVVAILTNIIKLGEGGVTATHTYNTYNTHISTFKGGVEYG